MGNFSTAVSRVYDEWAAGGEVPVIAGHTFYVQSEQPDPQAGEIMAWCKPPGSAHWFVMERVAQ